MVNYLPSYQNMSVLPPALKDAVRQNVAAALAEDVGSGDITAQLIPLNLTGKAQVISRETAILCGTAWVEETFLQLDDKIQLHWLANDGDTLVPDQPFLFLEGTLRSLLTGERTALNFLQLLSGTATTAHLMASKVAGTNVTLLDTRKTIPGLRLAQKYAVSIGGCSNHRMGLYDAFLIKENHITSAGSISAAIQQARQFSPEKSVEVEVENLEEVQMAITSGADIIMLDDFPLALIQQAVIINAGKSKLEISGGVNENNLIALAATGVDFISIGGLTKHCHAIDLSMRIIHRD